MVEASTRRFGDLEHLGTGGMASVYRAWDSRLGRYVALKRLRSDLRESVREDLQELFHREYRTLAELSHPRIIEVYDYGVDEDGPYYTMELLDGADLRSKVPVPWRDACAIARDVCSSLALLHSRGCVHRDISPGNVWLTGNGDAKLLDFGAMAPMGICKMLVGNPACVPPEALLQQPLDGRSDLFSVGAMLYWALTGRKAFPAKRFTDLWTLHRELPPWPGSLVADIPAELDRLVLSLLSIEAAARPRSAAEVMERLTALAALPELESEEVPRSYLARPALVGREGPLETFRERTRRLMAGRGGAVRLAGAPGMGRSRMLDACVLEAKLAGTMVLRSSAQDAAAGPYGVLQALLAELPSAAADQLLSARGNEAGIARLVKRDGPVPDDAESRPALHHALVRGLHEVARDHLPLVLAIDDFASIDEPSQAALLALAYESQRRPVVVLYTDVDEGPRFGDPTPLSTLRELAFDIEVSPLRDTELEQLLTSIFGDVPNLPTVASHITQRAQGSPRVCMELAQALVERGLARYERGTWALPTSLDEVALPATVTARRQEKLDQLGEDAREAVEALALAHRHVATASQLVRLCGHEDPERTEAALDALFAAGIVAKQGGHVRLIDDLWADVLVPQMSRARRYQVYRGLVGLLQKRGADPLLRVEALLEAGEETDALALLVDELSRGSRADDAPLDYATLLHRAVEACTRIEAPATSRFPLLRELSRLCLKFTIPGMREVFDELFAYLCHDSGLDDWHALTDVSDRPTRLHRALETVQSRYEVDPGRFVLAPADALRALVETVYEAATYATIMVDSHLSHSLPSLAPLTSLSPAIGAVEQAVHAQRVVLGARFEEAIEIYEARLHALEGPDRGGLDEEQAERSWFLIVYVIGALYAGLSLPGGLAYASRLDQYERGRIPAALVRHMYYQSVGNLSKSEQWGRRAEVLQIQQKRPHALAFTAIRQRIERAGLSDDLPTTTHVLNDLEEVVDRCPSFRPHLQYGRATLERLRGNYEVALDETRLGLSLVEAGKDVAWPWLALSEVECLRLMGRLDEAKQTGLARDEEAKRGGLRLLRPTLPLALVEAELGEFEKAMRRLTDDVAYREAMGMRGSNMGRSYEHRALVALWMGDADQFHRDAQQCATHYKEGHDNPAHAARYERLIQRARAQGVVVDDQLERAISEDSHHTSKVSMGGEQTVYEALAACEERQQRVDEALRLLREAADARAGWLYLVGPEGPEFVAGQDAPPAKVQSLAARLLDLEHASIEVSRAEGDETDVASDAVRTAVAGQETPDADPEAPRGLVLSFTKGTSVQMVGAVILAGLDPSGFMRDMYAVAATVSRHLAETGDASPRALG